jgi:hypothetical protein
MWLWRRWRIGCRNKMKNFQALLPCMRCGIERDIYRVEAIVMFVCWHVLYG